MSFTSPTIFGDHASVNRPNVSARSTTRMIASGVEYK
jgi:hypothetical protein